MNELSDLYQQMILDHNRRPRNFGKLQTANRSARGYNPLCGDQLTLYLDLKEDRISNISFEGSGCAISKASASIMTETLKGKTVAQVEELFQKVHRMLTGDKTIDPEEMGKLAVFSGVSEFPARVKCATLAWHTLKAAIAARQDVVSTEESE